MDFLEENTEQQQAEQQSTDTASMEKQQEPTTDKRYGKRTELTKQLIQETGITDRAELKRLWQERHPDMKPLSRSYLTQVIKEYEANPTAQTNSGEDKPRVNEPTEAEIQAAEKAASTPISQITAGIMSGKIGKEQIKAVFVIENKIINTVLASDVKLDSETVELLANVWEAPLNRLVAKYANDNMDLIIALGITVYSHLPLFLKLFKDYQEKRKAAKKA